MSDELAIGRRNSARVFDAILADELMKPRGDVFSSSLKGLFQLLLGWAAFLMFLFVPALQLCALCLCALAILFEDDQEDLEPAGSRVRFAD